MSLESRSSESPDPERDPPNHTNSSSSALKARKARSECSSSDHSESNTSSDSEDSGDLNRGPEVTLTSSLTSGFAKVGSSQEGWISYDEFCQGIASFVERVSSSQARHQMEGGNESEQNRNHHQTKRSISRGKTN